MITTAPLVRRTGVALATLGGLAAAAVALLATGAVLPFPAQLDPAALGAWAEQVGAPAATFTALRALALALVAWFTLAWVLGVAARLVRRPDAVRLLDRVSLPGVRRLADAVAGLAVIGATLTPGVAAAAQTSTTPGTAEAAVVVMTDLGPAVDDTSSPTAPGAATPPLPSSTTTSTTSAVAPADEPTPAPGPEPGGSDRPLTDRPPSRTAPAPGSIWVIAPGDTLWHVAEATLVAELGHPPTPAEIVERLEQLVVANRDRLAVPTDPGLVFPGQEFVLT